MRFLAILILSIAIGCIEDTLALKCYGCTSGADEDDPCTVGNPEKMRSFDCPPAATNCAVFRAPGNGVEIVYRTCSRDFACDNVPDGIECTLCDEDNCNAASGNTNRLSMAPSLTLFAILIAFGDYFSTI